jgi:hypothetical protein
MGNKRKKGGDNEQHQNIAEQEETWLSRMPQACGLPLVEKVKIGHENTPAKRTAPTVQGPVKATVRAKLCCAGCGVKWTAVVRTSETLPSVDDAAKSLASNIEADHLHHHVAAMSAAYKKAGAIDS